MLAALGLRDEFRSSGLHTGGLGLRGWASVRQGVGLFELVSIEFLGLGHFGES